MLCAAQWEFLMPVQVVRRLMVLTTVVALVMVLAACGSRLGAPPESRFNTNTTATPVRGTPPAELTGLAQQGYQLFQQFKCAECHSLQGQIIVGPPLNGLFGSNVHLENGQTVVADDAYVKLSILEPDAQIVNGFDSGVMSGHIMQFESQIAKDNNLEALIAFIKSQS